MAEPQCQEGSAVVTEAFSQQCEGGYAVVSAVFRFSMRMAQCSSSGVFTSSARRVQQWWMERNAVVSGEPSGSAMKFPP